MGIKWSAIIPPPGKKIIKTNLDVHDILLAMDDQLKVGVAARKEETLYGRKTKRYAVLREMDQVLFRIIDIGEKPFTQEGTNAVKRLCAQYAALEDLTHI